MLALPLLAYLRYDPLVRIHLGPLSISPHGMGIAVGFLLGSYFFLGWCRKAGLTDDQVYSLVNRAAIESIEAANGARIVVNFAAVQVAHVDAVSTIGQLYGSPPRGR